MKNFNSIFGGKVKSVLALALAGMMTLSGCGLFDDWDEGEVGDNGAGTELVSGGSSDDEVIPVENSLNVWDTDAVREKQVSLKGNGDDTVTILVYMNGSNLESDDGEASTDLSEMVAAGSSDKVNVLVQTMGTKTWTSYGISSKTTQRYKVDGNGLTLVADNLGQLDCTVSSTLKDFITWGAANYPADRYILLFWNHGGGPVYGFGYDEWNDDDEAALTIDEMRSALAGAGVFFDFIGFDCCIMACIEVCCALYDYCDYTVLSEDFESGYGWTYTPWLEALYANTSISTPELGKIICDEVINTNTYESDGDDSIMAVVDESMMKVLWTAWTSFAYANETTLLENNYSREVTMDRDGRLLPSIAKKFGGLIDWDDWDDYSDDDDEATFAEYYITDIMALASTLNTDESAALSSAVSNALVYVATTDGDSYLTGISVTLPYGDSDFYSSLSTIFNNCGFDSSYIIWLEKFTDAEGADDYYDYDDWDDDWDGWDDYDDDYDWGDWDWFGDDYDDYWDEWSDDDDWGWGFDDFWGDWDNDDWGYGDDYGDYGDWDDYGDYGDYGDWDDWGDWSDWGW